MRNKTILLTMLTLGIVILNACKKFIELEPPKNSLIPSTVFRSNDLATAAILGIYQNMAINGSTSGDNNSISTICALAADEYIGYSVGSQKYFQNQLTPSDTQGIWGMYTRIYGANTILEGLDGKNGLTASVRNQIYAESLFIRAFHYFYLVNLFGAVPLHLSTDYEMNSVAKRTSIEDVYAQIVKDLKLAETLISDTYVTTERVRPNKAAVRFLLARVYLFLGDWDNAEKYASVVIQDNGRYKLVDFNEIFLKNSNEAILQLMPPAGNNTSAGRDLIFTTTPTSVSVRPEFLNLFETDDKRKAAWTKSIISAGVTYYYPFKYRIQSSTNVTEYFMVFRLGELYLIRSEARAHQDNLLGAKEDLDKIRNRAGLLSIGIVNPEISKEGLLIAIQKERRIELFSEWGDRWFNLKRTGNISSVMALVKPNWKANYTLFPIPQAEINFNRNIIQNEGY